MSNKIICTSPDSKCLALSSFQEGVHGNRDLPIGTLTKLIKDANLAEDDLKK
ncbi:MAG: hypothetical protein F6K17_11960 [Okeania sp. SIO3C4]|nr:hypothetical protein [Okeania sp. SIO3B3]NER03277.1 hypothetical protein [Okeania sp. SIO3C4]